MIKHAHIEALKTMLGPKGWYEDAQDTAPFLHEWRDRWVGQTPLVIMPESAAQTEKIIQYCAAHTIGITPQGGNTGLVGGQIPMGEILLSTRRMNAIRAIDEGNASLIAEAGATLAAVRAAADEAGFLFPLSLASEGSATIGGILSTNAGGMEVVRYGNARALCLGLEAVNAQGQVWDGLSALRKDNRGYDLKQLFIGGEGTLGVITAASLKLFAKPAARETAWCALPSPHAAITLLEFMTQKCGDAVSTFELVPQIGIDCALRNIPGNRAPLAGPSPWHVLMELSFAQASGGRQVMESALGKALEDGLISDAALAQSQTQRESFFRLRESLSAAQKGEGVSIKHDIAVPISAIDNFIEEASAAVQKIVPGCRVFAFGHIGDGNVHFNVLSPKGAELNAFKERADAITEAVFECVLDLRGSFSAEHGIGVARIDALQKYKTAPEIAMMRAVKSALDPVGIMNPRVML